MNMLTIWMAVYAFEMLLFASNTLWRIRRSLAAPLIVAIGVSMLLLWLSLGFWWGALFGLLAVFRIGNMLRIIKARMHENYLRRVTTRTCIALFLLHLFVVGAILLPVYEFTYTFWRLLSVLQLLSAATLLVVAIRTIRKLRFKMPKKYLVDRELPTVSVLIPARNETTDLESCLKSLIANDYPKLEIIVLDDCSQERTAEIIKNFAHDGVRFIPGDPPQERWLAKNQAYERLSQEASGELLMFCGVDTRFGPQAIRSMVNLLYTRKKSMLGVLPTRLDSTPASAFIQPMRYWWELAFPRRLFNRPPVLSTCWMIGRSDLKKLGGFEAVSHSILPEGYFAREMVKTDQYSFVRSSNELQVQTVKSLRDQYETAIRTRYPQIRRRPENALVLTLANIFFLVGPFWVLIAGFWGEIGIMTMAAASCVLLAATHVMIVNTTDPANSLLACITFPVVALTELFLGYSSMIQYEFFTVGWKDRNICIPVMHVIPRLPDLPERPDKA